MGPLLRIRRWLLIGALTALAACAPTLERNTSAGQLSQKAIVILSVTHSYEVGAAADTYFFVDQGRGSLGSSIVLTSRKRMLSVPMPSDFDDLYGQLYVLDLKPGRHQVDSWEVRQGNLSRMVPRIEPQPLVFEARAGEVIYLGNLHMNMTRGRSLLGTPVPTGIYPEVKDRRDIDVAIAQTKHPDLKGRATVQLLPQGPWLSSMLAEPAEPPSEKQ